MGYGDVRLLKTIGSVDFTGQERAALNKLTMPQRYLAPISQAHERPLRREGHQPPRRRGHEGLPGVTLTVTGVRDIGIGLAHE